MTRLPIRKQITFGLIIGGVAFGTSLLLTILTMRAGQPGPSPLIGLTFGVVAGVVYLGLAGNRQMPLADKAERARALAPVTDGGGRLIVYREGFVGKLAGVDVHVDGAACTQLKSPRFAALTVTPGAHSLFVEVQKRRSDPLELVIAPNETQVVQIVVSPRKPALVLREAAAVSATLASTPMVRS